MLRQCRAEAAVVCMVEDIDFCDVKTFTTWEWAFMWLGISLELWKGMARGHWKHVYMLQIKDNPYKYSFATHCHWKSSSLIGLY